MSDTLKCKQVKTRKPHNCQGCDRTMPVGSAMEVVETVDYGDFCRTYWCYTCGRYFSMHCEYDDMVGTGDLRYKDPEEWERIRSLIEGVEVVR